MNKIFILFKNFIYLIKKLKNKKNFLFDKPNLRNKHKLEIIILFNICLLLFKFYKESNLFRLFNTLD